MKERFKARSARPLEGSRFSAVQVLVERPEEKAEDTRKYFGRRLPGMTHGKTSTIAIPQFERRRLWPHQESFPGAACC